MEHIKDSLQQFLEPIGQAIAYLFSLLPKWIRACFWAGILTAILITACLVFICFCMWLVQTLGGEFIVVAVLVLVIFLIALSAIWNDINAEKPKNDDREEL
jgi:hypothetical protein